MRYVEVIHNTKSVSRGPSGSSGPRPPMQAAPSPRARYHDTTMNLGRQEPMIFLFRAPTHEANSNWSSTSSKRAKFTMNTTPGRICTPLAKFRAASTHHHSSQCLGLLWVPADVVVVKSNVLTCPSFQQPYSRRRKCFCYSRTLWRHRNPEVLHRRPQQFVLYAAAWIEPETVALKY